MTVAIQLQAVTKTFRQKEVIKQCNMTVYEHQVYGLLGANGSGKTTIFKLILGLLNKTAGQITVFGEATDANTLRQIGSIIETPVFYEHLSAYDNLAIHLAYMGLPEENIVPSLELVGLEHTGAQPASEFSLGMRQRLALARAIVHRPKILILDEPTNGLDPLGMRDMRKLFQKLAETMTIIISSHLLGEIEHIAETIGVLVNGAIVEEVKLSEMSGSLEDYFFSLMTGGRHDVEAHCS